MTRRVPALAGFLLCVAVAPAIGQPEPRPVDAATALEFRGGLWFDGTGFRERTLYASDGVFRETRPARIDSVIDLAGRWMIPPLAEAHNHNVEASSRLAGTIRRYLEAGVFYVMNPDVLPRNALPERELVNRPTSVDVAFAMGGFTAPGGHPVGVVERNLGRGIWTEADGDGAFYYAVESEADLDRVWDGFLALEPDFVKEAMAGEAGVEIVAEAGDGPAAVTAVERHEPDVLFLDVRMPGSDGFDVLDAIRTRPRPWVVFVTAHDEYALRAFDAHAVDYVLKPFDDARIRRALGRARTMVRGSGREAVEERVRALLDAVLRPAGGRIAVRVGSRTLLLAPAEIDHVQADGNYVRLFVGGRTYVARRTLKEMHADLGETFVRIHRSRLVNFARVREVRATDEAGCVVVLEDGTRLEASESGRRRVEARLDRV